MYCKNCGTQIVDNASFCSQCGAAQEGVPTATAVINEKPVKKKKKLYQRWWFWVIIVLVAFVVFLSGGDDSNGDSAAQSGVDGQSEPEYIEVTPAALYSAYENNEVSADNEYKHKLLKISGTIDSIGKDILDEVYITFEAGNVFESIQCYFSEKEEIDKVATLSEGDTVTIIGKCDGKSLNVLVDDCVIVD